MKSGKGECGTRKGTFIALEGGEGSGKSTQAARLQARLLRERGHCILLREPGSTPLGDHLRSYLKSKRPLSLIAETMLFTAARAQMVEDIIAPALKQEKTVVCDRFMASTIAYQGYGRRGNMEMALALNRHATGGLKPDLTLLLDISPEEGLARVGKLQLTLDMDEDREQRLPRTGAEDEDGRRFEDLTIGFHRRVRKGYLQQARDNPGWTVVDAGRREKLVARDIWEAVRLILAKRRER